MARESTPVSIADIIVGGGSPVRIQTMWDEPLPSNGDDKAVESLLHRLRLLKSMGCDIIRFSYPDDEHRQTFRRICAESPMPVVADIHFDYRLAVAAIEAGAHKIRINPGNIGAAWKVEEVVRAAKEKNVAIRIGLNSGSLPKHTEKEPSDLMVDTALEYVSWFHDMDFHDIVVSLKASDPSLTYDVNVRFAEKSDVPLHLGVTEAGGIVSAVTRSTWVLGRLLEKGIGDTIRISITGSIETEVQAGVELLRTLGLRAGGINVISCPRCGRYSFDTQSLLAKLEPRLLQIQKSLTVAIMGCQVNGVGEASHADIAITGIGHKAFLYVRGKLVRDVSAEDVEQVLMDVVEEF
ncbi:flavodoxin-dependent (E)-4-hydroxy-3-methylbut-2-enyl-diphosphate synthase [Parasphaerochaeta coccoides]|uniref:4-hydroxy-3-methylbut-2-en-1-yl diphosphate synthase (flavodoxin) n=1 Tax=Parasphaerochaeta coccoides (strain ATCC BAA-1237 / DSM 17374 / SPN1) TaxID=760011 RepID=F4GII4_PARC1|nr:flavodoxin-dependent (E)-4-hydroxy-3-methylbut-2-enyl-diphosphate synthase [Parasphaerochaeta coccoides]AEC01692.1 4-hydroxy-3-methylbut-2-en-1-yl diphosphate synthase [Parasphaerochaeta coccoides DSM 17374]